VENRSDLDVVELARALAFGEDAQDECAGKLRKNHFGVVAEVFERLGEAGKAFVHVKFPGELRDEIVAKNPENSPRIVIHTRKEVFEGYVRFATVATMTMEGITQSLKCRAFNVKAG
jgi:hypothetical protein